MRRFRVLPLLFCLVLFCMCRPAAGASAGGDAAGGLVLKRVPAATLAAVGPESFGPVAAKAGAEESAPPGTRPQADASGSSRTASAGAVPGGAVSSTPGATVPAVEPKPGARWIEPETGMAFRWVPSGCFVMGSPRTERGRDPDEGPQHVVCLSGFWMGEDEVTQGQWLKVMGDSPSLTHKGDEYPEDMVSWDAARKFAEVMNSRSEGGFRLPTEAEWEYACRAGAVTAYSFGDALTEAEASYDRSFGALVGGFRRSGRPRLPAPRQPGTSPAGSFPANAYGLRDMHGNLWEWCADVYHAGYYARSPRDNPICLEQGNSRVMRGGSWVSDAAALRSANRGHGWPGMGTAFFGVRLVRDPHLMGHAAAK